MCFYLNTRFQVIVVLMNLIVKMGNASRPDTFAMDIMTAVLSEENCLIRVSTYEHLFLVKYQQIGIPNLILTRTFGAGVLWLVGQ